MAGGMHGRGHAWLGGMHGRWGMHDKGQGCAWQVAHAWQEGGVHGRGRAWQEKWPLQWAVRILLECILV